MVVGTAMSGSQVSSSMDRGVRARLEAQQVPDVVIEQVMGSRPIDDAQLAVLTPQQRTAVRDAQLSTSATKVGAGAGVLLAGGFSVFIFVASFVGGLLGWLLIMRKRVLQCSRCSATVAAS